MYVKPSLITNSQSPKSVEPGKRALHNPSVAPQLLATLDASPRNPRGDASLAKGLPVSLRIIPFVRMHFDRTLAWTTSSPVQGRDSIYHIIYHLLQHRGVRNVRSCTPHRQWYTSSTDHKMALRAWFALIRRVWACSLLPFFTPLAGTVAESTEALDQPISPASLSLSSSSLCSFFHTPACCQSLRRRQQVMPLPQPISWGNISHCKPDLSTNTMPVSAARSAIRGRPPLGLGGSGGKSGSITFHNSSDISIFAIPNFTKLHRFC
jgi:hypothetical protein